VSPRAAALSSVLRRLLVVAAAVALLGHGGAQIGPRLLSVGASATTAAGAAPLLGRVLAPRPVAESQPVERAAQVRSPLVAAAAAGSGDAAAGPGASPLVAPHLVARPLARPPTPSHIRGIDGSASGRAPPVSAGT
jgi:hypothetical protein